MSQKNNKTKRFVIIMSVLVIVIIVIGSWLTWKIVEDGMKKDTIQHKVELTMVHEKDNIEEKLGYIQIYT